MGIIDSSNTLPTQNGKMRTLQHPYQADQRTGEKITGISWIMNEGRGCVRGIITSEFGSQVQGTAAYNVVFVLEMESPLDELVKLYLERPCQVSTAEEIKNDASGAQMGPRRTFASKRLSVSHLNTRTGLGLDRVH